MSCTEVKAALWYYYYCTKRLRTIFFSYYLVNSSQIDDGLNKSPRYKRAKVVEVSWQRKVINYCIRFSTHKFGSCFTRKSYSNTRFWVVAALKFNFQFQIACYCNGSYLFFYTDTHAHTRAISLTRSIASFICSFNLSLALIIVNLSYFPLCNLFVCCFHFFFSRAK